MIIEFSLPLEAKTVQNGGKRILWLKKKGRPLFFKDKDTMAYYAKIKELAQPFAPPAPLPGPLHVTYTFVMERPQRLNRAKDNPGLIRHILQPDRDNLEKGTQDALSQCGFWLNDSQICDGPVRKFYAEKGAGPRIEVRIEQMETEFELPIQVEHI